jgi:hypothetical protein
MELLESKSTTIRQQQATCGVVAAVAAAAGGLHAGIAAHATKTSLPHYFLLLLHPAILPQHVAILRTHAAHAKLVTSVAASASCTDAT